MSRPKPNSTVFRIPTLILVTGMLALSSGRVLAQGNFSPYSQLGIGDLDDGYYNRTTGMSGTGQAYRNNRFLINNNPASYSALTDQYLVMELGIRGSLINYYGQPVDPSSTQSGDITFRRLALGIKAAKHWGSSLGLIPFSTQNYEFNVPTYLGSSTTQIANGYFQGHGSVNKVYWANSYDFFHHLSLGVDAGYLFGQLSQKEILQNGAAGPTLVSTTNNTNVSNLFMTYGLQVYGRIGKKWEYCLGGTFSPRTDLFAETERIVLGPDSVTLADEILARSYQPVPMMYGFGLSLTKDLKYTFLADYKYQDWGSLHYVNKGYELVNSQRASVGFEVSKKKVLFNTLVELSYLQAGVYYQTDYLQVYGQPIRDYGISAGFGVNSLKSPLGYNISVQYGQKGTTVDNLIQERYVNLNFGINFGNVLYTKGRKYD